MIKIKKYIPILTIIIVIIIFAGIILGKKSTTSPQTVNQAVEKSAEKTEETLKGSIKEMAEKGIPLKCTYKQGENEFEGLLKGNSWRGKMKTKDGQVAEVILKDNCMWSWNPTDKIKQGAKICFEEKESTTGEKTADVWDQSQVDNPDIQYTCLPATVSDSDFEPPKDIQFMDLNQIKY